MLAVKANLPKTTDIQAVTEVEGVIYANLPLRTQSITLEAGGPKNDLVKVTFENNEVFLETSMGLGLTNIVAYDKAGNTLKREGYGLSLSDVGDSRLTYYFNGTPHRVTADAILSRELFKLPFHLKR